MLKNPETRKNIGKGIFWLFLTFGFIFLIFKFGITAAVKISEFLQRNKPGNEGILTDNYLPAPKFSSVPEATNSATLSIYGYAPANKEVVINLNNSEYKSLATDSEGKFSGEIELSLGTNSFYGFSKDFDSKTSVSSPTYSIFFSDTPPPLEIIDPIDLSTIKNNPDITIKGKTDSRAKVYVDNHQILVNSDGTFSHFVKLQKGENKFIFSSLDLAQNKKEIQYTLNFKP